MLHRLRTLPLLLSFTVVLGLASVSAADAAVVKAPAGVSASVTTDSITVKWKSVKNANGYSICLTKAASDKKCFITSPIIEDTTWTATKLKPTSGVDYYATVRAHSGKAVVPAQRIAVHLAPFAPENVAVSTTKDSAKVTWSKAKNATGYTVCFRQSQADKNCWKTSKLQKGTSFTLKNLKPTGGGDYYVTVKAHRIKSANSAAPVRADLQIGTIPTPKVAKKDYKSATIQWDKPVNADKFTVEFFNDQALTQRTMAKTVSTTQFSTAELEPDTAYQVRITPMNSDISGQPSDVIVLKTDPPPGVVVTVVSYNLCGRDQCLSRPYPHFPGWTTRLPMIQAAMLDASPDVIATQEDPAKMTLTGYTNGQSKSSKSVLYKSSKFTKVRSGYITMPRGDSSMTPKYAPWVELKDKKYGLRFIVAGPHLQHMKGARYDNARKIQTEKLMADLAKINTANLPIVIAGDMNSNSSNANQSKYPGGYDAPAKTFSEAGLVNTVKTAESVTHAKINTANQAAQATIPPFYQSGHHVDAIWTSPEVEAQAWTQLVRLNGNAYVTPFLSDHNPIQAKLLIKYLSK